MASGPGEVPDIELNMSCTSRELGCRQVFSDYPSPAVYLEPSSLGHSQYSIKGLTGSLGWHSPLGRYTLVEVTSFCENTFHKVAI